MGFEEATTSKVGLPTDLPTAKEASAQHPDGAIYRSDNGKRYRLRHPRWVEVAPRQSKKPATAAKK